MAKPETEYTDNPYTLFAIRAIKEDAVKEILRDLTQLLDDESIISHERALREYVLKKAAELLKPSE